MRYLEEQKIGFNTGGKSSHRPSAILSDLNLVALTSARFRHGLRRGCFGILWDAPAEGNAGVGMGPCRKMFGLWSGNESRRWDRCSLNMGAELLVARALVAVNAWEMQIDLHTNQIIVGLRSGKVGPLSIGKKGGPGRITFR